MENSVLQENVTLKSEDDLASIIANRSKEVHWECNMLLGMMPRNSFVRLSPSFFSFDKKGDLWIDPSRPVNTNRLAYYGNHNFPMITLDRLGNGEFVCTDNPNSVWDVFIPNARLNTDRHIKVSRHNLKSIKYTKRYSEKHKEHFWKTFEGFASKAVINEDGFKYTTDYRLRDCPRYTEFVFADPHRYDAFFYIGSTIRHHIQTFAGTANCDYSLQLLKSLAVAFEVPLEDMPLHVNDAWGICAKIAKWRLEIGR